MNIYRIEVPAPMEIGDVNSYLIVGNELTVVDPGPDNEETFKALEKGLKEKNVSVEEIDNLLITHPHSDHFGNASKIQKISDATVYAHRDAKPLLENFQTYGNKMKDFFRSYLQKQGVPETYIDEVVEEGIPNQFGTSLSVDKALKGGENIIEDIDVIETPGHAKGSLSFLINGQLIAGDTIIRGMTPNPTLQLPVGGDVPSSLELYLNTLEKLKSMNIGKVYGGHRAPIENLDNWIEDTKEHHQERKNKVLEELNESKTGYEVMKTLFRDIEPKTYFLGMSESIAHLKLLESENKIESFEKNERVYFRSS